MRGERSVVSIVIATFNGRKTLPLVLKSIKKQTFPQEKIEVLVVDGGSTDSTLEVARQFGCRIVKNSKAEPVSSKILGFQRAKGRYLIYLDQDELIDNPESLSLKYQILQKETKVKAIIGSGYRTPPNAPFTTTYINEFGDPFSFFIYRMSKNYRYFIKELRQNFRLIKENGNGIIFNFSDSQKFLLMELGAANTMIDLDYTRKEFSDFDIDTFSHLFHFFRQKGVLIAVTKNDSITHYATTTFSEYLNKIRWRVKNNIYYASGIGISGFSGREKFHPRFLKFKKYLFIPYAYSVIFPLGDAIYLAVTRRKIAYLLHLPLTIFTASLMVYHSLLKTLGFKPKLRSYDESVEVPESPNGVN